MWVRRTWDHSTACSIRFKCQTFTSEPSALMSLPQQKQMTVLSTSLTHNCCITSTATQCGNTLGMRLLGPYRHCCLGALQYLKHMQRSTILKYSNSSPPELYFQLIICVTLCISDIAKLLCKSCIDPVLEEALSLSFAVALQQ